MRLLQFYLQYEMKKLFIVSTCRGTCTQLKYGGHLILPFVYTDIELLTDVAYFKFNIYIKTIIKSFYFLFLNLVHTTI
jgi:hypothetical protein